MPRRALALISGKDVIGAAGGHASYVRAHTLAAARAGFEPHVFCAARRARTVATEFGVVHHVAAPLGAPLPVALEPSLLAPAVVRFLERRPGPHVIHGFALWAAAAAGAARTLSRRGVPAVALASAYGTRAFEVGAMQHGLRDHHGLAHRARYRAWLGWIRLVDDRVERRGYARSELVLVNYDSVARILARAYGPDLPVRRAPYASEQALLADREPPRGAIPGPLARPGAADAPLVLAVSRHDPRKGIDVLLLALAELAARGSRSAPAWSAAGDCSARTGGSQRSSASTAGPRSRDGWRTCARISPAPTCSSCPRSPRRAARWRSSRRCAPARRWWRAHATESPRTSRTATTRCSSRRATRALSPARSRRSSPSRSGAHASERGRATHERSFSTAGFEAALAGVYAELTASAT